MISFVGKSYEVRVYLHLKNIKKIMVHEINPPFANASNAQSVT